MIIGIMKLKLMAPWVKSLKEKRMVIKSIIGKVSNKFNVSISEVELLDVHQTIILGVVQVGNDKVGVERILNKVINYIEENTEANLLEIEIEIENF